MELPGQIKNKLEVNLKENKQDVLYLFLILLLGAFLRLYNLGYAPYFFIDEGLHFETALHVLNQHELARFFFNVPILGKPPLYFILLAGSFKFLGFGVWQGRIVSAFFGMSIICLVYVFSRHYFGRNVAIISSIFYSVNLYSVKYDRMALMDTTTTFFALIAIIVFYLGYTKRDSKTVLVSGFVWGLAMITKYTVLYVWLAIFLFLTYASYLDKEKFRSNIKALFYFSIGSLGPILAWVAYMSWYSGAHAVYYPSTGGIAETFFGWPNVSTFVSTILTRWGKFLLNNELHMFGLVGILYLILARKEINIYLSGFVVYGVFFYSMFYKFGMHYVHSLIPLLSISGAFLLTSLMDKKPSKKNITIFLLLFLIGFKWFYIGSVYTLSTDDYEIVAAEYIRENIPQDAVLYCSPSIGVLTKREYIPFYAFNLEYPFSLNPSLKRFFNVRNLSRYLNKDPIFGYIIIDRDLRVYIGRDEIKDPRIVFNIRLIKTVGEGTSRVEIYKIENKK